MSPEDKSPLERAYVGKLFHAIRAWNPWTDPYAATDYTDFRAVAGTNLPWFGCRLMEVEMD
jgi:hypothetical protein